MLFTPVHLDSLRNELNRNFSNESVFPYIL